MRFATAFFFFLACFLIFTWPAQAATIIGFTPPATIDSQNETLLEINVNAEASLTFSLKFRLGSSLNSLSDGLTYNSENLTWLSDTSPWSSFQKFTTDQNGNWKGLLKVKASSKAVDGENYFLVRLHRENGTNSDSNSVFISVQKSQPSSPPLASTNFKISLNEVMPFPETGDEWVEIFNSGPDQADLTGWKVDDEEGGSSPTAFAASTKISPQAFYVIYLKNKLNNDKDSVRLINPEGSAIDQFSYQDAQKGESFAFNQGKWSLTTTPTTGSANKITLPKTPLAQNPSETPSSGKTLSVSDSTNANLETTSTTSALPSIAKNNQKENQPTKTLVKAENKNSQQFLLIILGLIIVGSSFLVFAFLNPQIKKRLFSFLGKTTA